jgi:hypothetical protein
MKCQKSSARRCTAGAAELSTSCRAAVVFPAPGGPVRMRMVPEMWGVIVRGMETTCAIRMKVG